MHDTLTQSDGMAEIVRVIDTDLETALSANLRAGQDPETPARVLHCMTRETGDEFLFTLKQPKGFKGWMHEKSALARFVSTYGGLPEPGMAIEWYFDDYYRVALGPNTLTIEEIPE